MVQTTIGSGRRDGRGGRLAAGDGVAGHGARRVGRRWPWAWGVAVEVGTVVAATGVAVAVRHGVRLIAAQPVEQERRNGGGHDNHDDQGNEDRLVAAALPGPLALPGALLLLGFATAVRPARSGASSRRRARGRGAAGRARPGRRRPRPALPPRPRRRSCRSAGSAFAPGRRGRQRLLRLGSRRPTLSPAGRPAGEAPRLSGAAARCAPSAAATPRARGARTTAVPGAVAAPSWLITLMSNLTRCSPSSTVFSLTTQRVVSTSCLWLIARNCHRQLADVGLVAGPVLERVNHVGPAQVAHPEGGAPARRPCRHRRPCGRTRTRRSRPRSGSSS